MPFPYTFPFQFDPQTTSPASLTATATLTCTGLRTAYGAASLTAGATLTAAGRNFLTIYEKGNVLTKLVLTSGETTYTYYSYDRIKKMINTEQPHSYTAVALLDNHDNTFTELDLKGFTATLSWGFRTSIGDLYIARPPMKVVDMQFISSPGTLLCYLVMNSALDRMASEPAQANYNPSYSGTGDYDWAVKTEAAAGASTITIQRQYSSTSTAEIASGTKFVIAGDATVYTVTTKAIVNNKNHWAPNTAYALNAEVIPTDGNENGRYYRATADGTSDATTEPIWPETYSATVDDPIAGGEITWTNYGADVVLVFTPVLAATAHATDAVTLSVVGDTATPKDHIDTICAATMTGFTNYDAITTSWDSEDSLIDVLIPLDAFVVYQNSNSRRERIEWLTRWTKEVYRLEADGKLHFINPTVSGTVYDYVYTMTSDCPFLAKTYQSSIVRPNSVSVTDLANTYAGAAQDASYAVILYWCNFIFPIISNDQGNSVAGAIIQRSQLDAQGGTIKVPIMNIGQKVWDYVKVTDTREGAVSRTINIQKIVRTWDGIGKNHRFDMTITAGGSGNIPSGNAISSSKDPAQEAIMAATEQSYTASGEFTLQVGDALRSLIDENAQAILDLTKRFEAILGAYDPNAATSIKVEKLEVTKECIVPPPSADNHAATKLYVDT